MTEPRPRSGEPAPSGKFLRLAAHALGLLVGLAAAGSLPPESGAAAHRAAVFLCAYAGIIALLPHAFRPLGPVLVSLLAGLLPAAALVWSGAPWQLVLLWAGLAALGCRLLYYPAQRRAAVWLLPVLALALLSFGLDLLPLGGMSLLKWSLVTALAAWLGSRALRSLARLQAIQANPILKDRAKRRRVLAYQRQLNELRDRLADTPPALHPLLGTIGDSGEAMLASMLHSPAHFPAGDRFLARYLPKALELVSAHLDLLADRQADPPDRPDPAVSHSAGLLARLTAAFCEQLKAMREDRDLDLQADLAVLDKLLKMDGQ